MPGPSLTSPKLCSWWMKDLLTGPWSSGDFYKAPTRQAGICVTWALLKLCKAWSLRVSGLQPVTSCVGHMSPVLQWAVRALRPTHPAVAAPRAEQLYLIHRNHYHFCHSPAPSASGAVIEIYLYFSCLPSFNQCLLSNYCESHAGAQLEFYHLH